MVLKTIFIASFLVLAIIYSIFYSHSDINHTAVSSYAILNGHIVDFYEYNKIKMGGNDYLPLLYWIFAVWNYPFCFFLEYCFNSNSLGYYDLLIQKVLLATLFGLSIKLIQMIAREVTQEKDVVTNVTLFYASSTIMMFCIFAFNQYDIIGMVLSLYGILFYVRNKLFRFSILFSAAISIKYFAILAFLPALLLKEKRIPRVLFYCIIASLVVGFQLYVYKDSPQFIASFFNLALRKISSGSGGMSLGALIFPVSYLIILIMCWRIRPGDIQERFRLYTITCILSYLLLYLKVDWHPQWICIIMPYLAFSLIYSNKVRLNLTFQCILSISYFLLVISRYSNNLDNLMLGSGFLGDYFGNSHIPILSVYKNINFKIVTLLFYGSISYFLISTIISNKIKPQGVNYLFQINSLWISNLIFLLPSLLIAFSSPATLLRFDPTADLRNRSVERVLNGNFVGSYFGEIKKGDQLTQFFIPERPNLIAISFIFGTYNKPVDNIFMLEIYNDKEILYNKEIDFTKIYANSVTNFKNINIGNKCDSGCFIKIKSVSGDHPIQIWVEKNSDKSYEKFSYNNTEVLGSLSVERFYLK